ncbi:alpha/beta fold hydrolase [Streptosporangium sp. NPDC002721]|uniref:alpha/beta fold hydrolase n=1 Tax=Streptosporangium sp. NPDC002721 TaxID=3366188 RepID=UPI0036A1519D
MAIFVQEAGPTNASAVVLLHGVGTSGWMWTKQVHELATDTRVLVLDLPGHGRSNTHPWVSIADTARLVAEVIASRVPEGRAHVVGLSLGGYVGALPDRHRRRVSGGRGVPGPRGGPRVERREHVPTIARTGRPTTGPGGWWTDRPWRAPR